jgi:tryptophan-rich sensory protein
MEYFISFGAVAATAILGSVFTSQRTNTEWYKCIKPRGITPPNFIFPIVWTVLYFLLFLAFARSLKLKFHTMSILFVLSFILQVIWCYLYFAKKEVNKAAIIIVLLVLTTLGMVFIATYKKEYHLANLIMPYLLWISFATFLNFMSLPKIKICSGIAF